MSLGKNDDVPPPPAKCEYHIKFANRCAAVGWKQLMQQIPANTNTAWQLMRKTPSPAVETDRHHRLKYELAEGVREQSGPHRLVGAAVCPGAAGKRRVPGTPPPLPLLAALDPGTGTPPPARGPREERHPPPDSARNTPACAGTTRARPRPRPGAPEHPRLRGDHSF
ncbi:hypothetical protein GCM10010298_03190 [Streptomyces microflavus]|uniref:Uncharacterized protein n=1 Tax=Streptomyces microflavus TaxID=1919 RepID=A0A7J0CND6_STRMI|nr:hypothetical protein Smic_25520 [Streptomyces microflavus]GGX43550.1 hypothetical protein GCM10010298_03190 [Streptomyces microflavus]